MKKYRFSIPLLIGSLLLLSFGSCNYFNSEGEKGIFFKLNIDPDIVYHYLIENEQIIEGMDREMNLFNAIEVDYKKIKDSADLQILQTEIKNVAIKVKAPGNNINFDSKKGNIMRASKSPIDPILSILNQKFITHVAHDGKINQILHSTQKQPTKDVDSMLMEILSKTFDFYPQQNVDTGDSWKTESQMEVQGISTKLKTTYTLDKIWNDTAFIKAKAILSSEERELIMQGMPMKIKMNGSQTGELKVYIPEGRLLNANYTSEINGVFKFLGQELKNITKGKSTITNIAE